MGNTKFDLITSSKSKGYKIGMISVIGFGIVLLIVGFILMATVTTTVMPNTLTISMSGLEGSKQNYTALISQNEFITVDTGTGEKPLSVPITFTMDDDAKTIFQEISPSHRAGIFLLQLKDSVADNVTGTLTITCGSMQPVKIIFTTYITK